MRESKNPKGIAKAASLQGVITRIILANYRGSQKKVPREAVRSTGLTVAGFRLELANRLRGELQQVSEAQLSSGSRSHSGSVSS